MMTIKTSTYHNWSAFTKNPTWIEELINYGENTFVPPNAELQLQSFRDEAQALTWKQYVEASEIEGVYDILHKHLVQFRFPIQTGISQIAAYKTATLKGGNTAAMPEATGLQLEKPDKLRLYLYRSLAGNIPVLVVDNRADFKSIIQALCYRNEPQGIPDSMGAAMIKGLNNWHRLHKLKSNWLLKFPDLAFTMENLVAQKAEYQDRIIILSRIPYSNVSAEDIGLQVEDWLDKSLQLRLEHECAHYFTLRYFGRMTNHLHDEIIADYMGIRKAWGQFRADWFLHFMGLENYPDYRPSGRFKNYLGKKTLSSGALQILQTVVFKAAKNIETFDQNIGRARDQGEEQARMLTLCSLGLAELASSQAPDQLSSAYHKLIALDHTHGKQ